MSSSSARLKETFEFRGLRYRVLNVREHLADYEQQYDQRQSRLSPGFKSESLTVLEVEVTNPTPTPSLFTEVVPALTYGEGSTTDRAQWDVEQKSFVRTGNALQQNPQDVHSFALDPVTIAPGGKVRFALIFSVPTQSKSIQLSFQSGATRISSGVLITMPTAGPTVNVSLVNG